MKITVSPHGMYRRHKQWIQEQLRVKVIARGRATSPTMVDGTDSALP